MLFGPHTEKVGCPQYQRSIALQNDWTCFQTMVGNPRSLNPPIDILSFPGNQPREPMWWWHAAYVCGVNPSIDNMAATSSYLAALINNADKFHISGIVVHVGTTANKSEDEVIEGIFEFLNEFSIADLVNIDGAPKLAIEIGANLCEFNSHPEPFLQALKSKGSKIGWCLDLAHAPAAGITWRTLRELIEYLPPLVCHCNFPGSEPASGQDIHGWRTDPSAIKHGRTLRARPKEVVDRLTAEWDETLHLLKLLNVPLVLEGSGFTSSTMSHEMRKIQEILQ